MVGLILAIMVGPLTISLLYTSAERGMRAGFVVGAGIWISDLLFMFGVYYMFNRVLEITQFTYFEEVMGIAGFIILLLIGLGIILRKDNTDIIGATSIKATDFVGYLSQGFMINTVNPFTFFFWTSVMGAVIVKNEWYGVPALLYFGGILFTIVTSDSLKVFLAKKLSKWLTTDRLKQIRLYSGVALILFGVVLAFRVLIF